MSTESELKDWRFGQVQAERLACDLLHVEGFEFVDPQHPLGGPDGTKDVICSRGGLKWIAAVYFPTTPSSFSDIRHKFCGDLIGLQKNNAVGFAFFVNQHLTVGEREILLSLAPQDQCEIYWLERIRGILDSPKGCGIRLQYLRIPMTLEEQWSFWNAANYDVARQLANQEKRREAQLQTIEEKLDLVLARTNAIGYALTKDRSHFAETSRDDFTVPTASISVSAICWLHRVITESSSLPEAVRGRLRTINVWVGQTASTPETALFVPPPPEEVAAKLDVLLASWRDQYSDLTRADRAAILEALAKFHHTFLSIHPFTDANGRLARVLTDQAAQELLNQSLGPDFRADPEAYFSTLRAADDGNLAPLILRIAAALR